MLRTVRRNLKRTRLKSGLKTTTSIKSGNKDKYSTVVFCLVFVLLPTKTASSFLNDQFDVFGAAAPRISPLCARRVRAGEPVLTAARP